MLIITGGAGFIGSNMLKFLSTQTSESLVVCDHFDHDQRWRNLHKTIYDIVHPSELLSFLDNNWRKVKGIFHLGAISSTVERDINKIWLNNIRFSIDLLQWCTKYDIAFIYASSAATYGMGEHGFSDRDDLEYLEKLHPLNAYGWSKHIVDKSIALRAAKQEKLPPKYIGLKFFNVYGPNEYHKGKQSSVVLPFVEQILHSASVKLFASNDNTIANGEQKRDFVHVNDCVKVMYWFLQNTAQNGLYNVGTGKAESFNAIANNIFKAMNLPPNIQYIAMPDEVKNQYQNYTKADMKKLRSNGYTEAFINLDQGVQSYVKDYILSQQYA